MIRSNREEDNEISDAEATAHRCISGELFFYYPTGELITLQKKYSLACRLSSHGSMQWIEGLQERRSANMKHHRIADNSSSWRGSSWRFQSIIFTFSAWFPVLTCSRWKIQQRGGSFPFSVKKSPFPGLFCFLSGLIIFLTKISIFPIFLSELSYSCEQRRRKCYL